MSKLNSLLVTYTKDIATGKTMRVFVNGNEMRAVTGLTVKTTPTNFTEVTISLLVSGVEVGMDGIGDDE